MNPNPHGGYKEFECANCHMKLVFPAQDELTGKMEGTYWIQDQWFCCKLCAQMSYGDQEIFNRKYTATDI